MQHALMQSHPSTQAVNELPDLCVCDTVCQLYVCVYAQAGALFAVWRFYGCDLSSSVSKVNINRFIARETLQSI